MEDHGSAGQFLGVVVLGEAEIEVLLLAGRSADKLLLKAGDEAVAAEPQLVALGGAALKGHAVLLAFVVDDHRVAFRGGTLHGDDAGNLFGLLVQLGLDLFVGDGDGGLGGLQALVLAQLDLGIELYLDGQLQGLVLADVHIGNRGLTHGLPALVGDGFLVHVGEDLFHRVAVKYSRAVEVLDHLPGGLALAEAGNGDVLAVLQVGLGNAGLEDFLLDLDLDGQLIVLSVRALDGHF